MLNAELLCVGKANQDFIRQGCAEYQKRLTPYLRVHITELAEGRLYDESSGAAARAMAEEGERFLKRLQERRALTVALCVEGRQMPSEAFAALLQRAAMEKGEIVFLIGGSHGMAEEVKRRADVRLSLSQLTMPHQLARLVLMEQLYRGAMINAGRTYHK